MAAAQGMSDAEYAKENGFTCGSIRGDQRSMLGGAFKRLKGLCRTQAGVGGHLLQILQIKQTDEKLSVDLCTAVGRTYQGEEAAGRAAKLNSLGVASGGTQTRRRIGLLRLSQVGLRFMS